MEKNNENLFFKSIPAFGRRFWKAVARFSAVEEISGEKGRDHQDSKHKMDRGETGDFSKAFAHLWQVDVLIDFDKHKDQCKSNASGKHS